MTEIALSSVIKHALRVVVDATRQTKIQLAFAVRLKLIRSNTLVLAFGCCDTRAAENPLNTCLPPWGITKAAGAIDVGESSDSQPTLKGKTCAGHTGIHTFLAFFF